MMIGTSAIADASSYVYTPPLAMTAPGRATCASGITAVSSPELVGPFLDRFRSTQPLFACVAAHTDTSSIPGISSAGASLELIPWTPAADLEALLRGRPVSLPTVPSNPLGPPGPALITRSALALAGIPWLPITIGLPIRPAIATLEIGHGPGGRIDLDRGLADSHALFTAGQRLGATLVRTHNALVIAETVPGGTTTAMAVLRALGSHHAVSSSSAEDTSSIKQLVVDKALQRASLRPNAAVFEVLNAVGDPMQPFVIGMVCSAAREVPVILAGGTQMAAVLAVVDRLEQSPPRFPRSNVLLATTPWVARDPLSDLQGILNDRGGWAGAIAELDFSASECLPLRAYERRLVKEGVGAGGACVAALALGRASLAELHREIDAEYLALLPDSRA
jgi:uncharacterized protein (TIGR00303 family)